MPIREMPSQFKMIALEEEGAAIPSTLTLSM
jgi:hypothetical protein